MQYIIGQIFGVIAVILGFVSFQMKSLKKLLFVHTAITVVFCIHYALIGAFTGFILNAVGFIRNIVYYNRDKKYLSSPVVPVIVTAVMLIAGILSWNRWYSVFFVVALVVNCYCMSFKNPDNIKRSILVTSPLSIVYDALASSWGGIVFESVGMISSAISLIRSRKNKKTNGLL